MNWFTTDWPYLMATGYWLLAFCEKGVHMNNKWPRGSLALLVIALSLPAWAQNRPEKEPVDTWVTVTASAAGVTKNAESEAVNAALRKAVEQACGTFIKGQTKIEDYQTTYDKVFADTAGYVLEHKVLKVTKADGETEVRVQARVSTVKFEAEWARAAHTINQEGNPRVLVTIAEATSWRRDEPQFKDDGGVVQAKVENFLNDKGLQLMDKATVKGVTNRDLVLATIKDDAAEQAAIGAKFKADVIITGKATVRYSKKLEIGQATMHQYSCTLTVRAIQCDSGRILMSNTYTLSPTETSQGAEDKALVKLANDAAPKILKDVLEAWRKRANSGRTVQVTITGMNRPEWKKFETEVKDLDGVTAIRLREITEGVASIEVECKLDTNQLADRIEELKDLDLEIVEQNTNRLKCKVVK